MHLLVTMWVCLIWDTQHARRVVQLICIHVPSRPKSLQVFVQITSLISSRGRGRGGGRVSILSTQTPNKERLQHLDPNLSLGLQRAGM